MAQNWLARRWPAWLAAVLVAIPVGVQGVGSIYDYFGRWATATATVEGYSSGSTAIAAFLKAARPVGRVYVSTDNPEVVEALAPSESAGVTFFHSRELLPLNTDRGESIYLFDGLGRSTLEALVAAHSQPVFTGRDPNSNVVVARGYRATSGGPVWTPPPNAPRATFGGTVSINGVEMRPDAEDPDSVLIFVGLRAERDEPGYLSVSVRAVDAVGQVWGQQDGSAADIVHWKAGQEAVTLHRIRYLVGTPPGEVRIEARVYQVLTLEQLARDDGKGPSLDLGSATVRRTVATGPGHDFPALSTVDVELPGCLPGRSGVPCPSQPGAAGTAPPYTAGSKGRVRLVGVHLSTDQPMQGDVLTLDLLWTCEEPSPRGAQLVVQLQDASGHVQGAFEPTNGLRATPPASCVLRTSALDHRSLQVGSHLTPGSYNIVSAFVVPGDPSPIFAPIGRVDIQPRTRSTTPVSFDRPVGAVLADGMTLRGLSMKTGPDGRHLDVGLVWEASGEPARDYTVFVHILGPDGRVIAQHDGPPDGGSWPTTWWETGQVVTDPHVVALPAAGIPPGSSLEIGAYDAQSGQRVSVLRTSAGAVQNDAVLLPVVPDR